MESVSLVKVAWDATPYQVHIAGSRYYLSTASMTRQAPPWTSDESHTLVDQLNPNVIGGWAIWVYPVSVAMTWGGFAASQDTRKTVIVAERVGGGYQTTNPGGTVSTATGTKYSFSVSTEDSAKGTINNYNSRSFDAIYANDSGKYVSGTSSVTCTAIPKPGYKFSNWSGDTGRVTINGDKVTINSNVLSDVTLVAHFVQKTAADGYNIYFRWTSSFSETEGGAEVVDREHRLATGTSGTTLRYFSSTSSSALASVTNATPRRWKSGSYYYANYIPLADLGADYWEGRNVGALRASGQEIKAWELRSVVGGSAITTIPADGTTTIADIAALLDDANAPWNNNANGDYRMAYLTAVFGFRRTVSTTSTGAENEETAPSSSTDPASGFEGATVSLATQTSGLSTCAFSHWSVKDASDNDVPVTEGETAGTATFAMPDSNVTATAVYELLPSCSVDVSAISASDASVAFSREADITVGGVGKWIAGTTLGVTISPAVGRKVSAWSVIDSNGNAVITSSLPQATTEPQTVNVNLNFGDIRIVAVFEAVEYTVSASKDTASASAITSVSVSDGTSSAASLTVDHGASVEYAAVLESGFRFAGWYDQSDGELVDSATPYSETATANRSLVAKAAAPVSIVFKDGSGNVVTEGVSVALTGVEDGYAVLGSTVGYELSLGDWYLDSWFAASDTQHVNPLVMGMSGEIAVTGAASFEVRLSATEPTRTIKVCAVDAAGYPLDVENFVTFSDVTTVASQPSSGFVVQGDANPGEIEHTFTGTKIVQAVAVGTVLVDIGETDPEELVFGGWYDSNSGGSLLASTLEINLLTSSNRTVYIRYRTAAPVPVRVALVAGDEGRGTVSVGDGGEASASVTQGDTVIVHATAKSGWLFAGWFASATPPSYDFPVLDTADAETGPIYADTTFYAHFVRDTDFICEWEGSKENKTLEWRSKIYVASKPFNPSACRVDTEGYPLEELDVEMFSSPDTEPTAVTTLTNIASQDARRLPVRRNERYMAVRVKNSHEVDRLLVGTSMEGIAV